MGGKIQYSGRDTYIYYDMRPSEHGNNERIDAELRTGQYGLPVTFRAGLSTVINRHSNMPLLVAVDLTEPADNYRSMNVGGEWAFYDTVFLRAGYAAIFEPDSEKGLTAGAGLKFDIPSFNIPVLIDYSYEDFGILNNAQRFSLSIAF